MTKSESFKIFNTQQINEFETRYRAHFINSLSGYKSANIIGSVDKSGHTNACIVSSVIHLGADPAYIAFINRPHTVERHTLENIIETGVYTINQVNADIFQAAHHTSARYPREMSEFDQTSLNESFTAFGAPYVEQSLIKVGVELRQKMDLEINGTVMVIGEIVEIIVADELISTDGKVDITKANTVCVSGLDEYHIASSLGRLEYAKPKI